MANAKRCDRCGVYYMPNTDKKHPILYSTESTLIPLDLCHDCSKELMTWLTEFRKGEDEDEKQQHV